MDAATLRLILIVAGAAFLLALYLWERARAESSDGGDWDDEGAGGRREPDLGRHGGAPYGTDRSPGAAEDFSVGGRGAGQEYAPAMAEDDEAGIELRADRDEEVPWDWIEASPEDRPGGTVQARAEAGGSVEAEEPPRAGDDAVERRDDLEPMLVQLFVVSTGEPFPGERIAAAALRLNLQPGSMDIFHRRVSDDGGALFSMANLVKPGSFPLDAMDAFESPGLALFAQLHGEPSDLMLFDEMLHAARSLADELGGEVQERSRAPLTEEQARSLRARVSERIGLDTGAEPEG